MAPNTTSVPSGILYENEKLDDRFINAEKKDKIENEDTYKPQPVWRNIIALGFLHIGFLYGVCLIFTSAKILTTMFAHFLVWVTGTGITAGVHRLWSHRSYKANVPLRLLLTFMNTMAFQMPIVVWARDHRLHHKYSETNADPYSAKRGFFFTHIGFLMYRKHPDVLKKGKEIDMSDLYADPILRFQKKYYYSFLMPLCCFFIPSAIPVYLWNETWTNAFYVAAIYRWVTVFHRSALVNSVAHFYGNKPYDKNMWATENIGVSLAAYGEGWHNYHHCFPWDYKTSELGNYSVNITKAFIDFFAWLGWAYDLKTVPMELVKARVHRTGDGSHELWGWGDKDISKEDQEGTIITHKN